MPPQPKVIDMGRTPFATARDRMLRDADSIRKSEVPGNILLVEHDPVYTAGRATPAEDLTPDIVPIERGGQITYHGPGQLVVYPVIRLPRHDVRAWLRTLEHFGVELCRAFGLEAEASVDGTGVFVGQKKVISIGVAIRHWINLHGLSINVAMDLDAFRRIRPCGLAPDIMSDLSQQTGRSVSMEEAKEVATSLVPILLEMRTPGAAS